MNVFYLWQYVQDFSVQSSNPKYLLLPLILHRDQPVSHMIISNRISQSW